MAFTIILSRDSKGGIGKGNALAVKLKADLAHFGRTTTQVSRPGKHNAVIMGRKTWESLPTDKRPLPERLNVVLTRKNGIQVPKDVRSFSTLDEALFDMELREDVERVFVIGGAKVLEEALRHPECERLILTEIEGDYGCDVFFPMFSDKEFAAVSTSDVMEEGGVKFRFVEYERV